MEEFKDRVGYHLDVVATRLANTLVGPVRGIPQSALNRLILSLGDVVSILDKLLGQAKVSYEQLVLMNPEVWRLDVSVDVVRVFMHDPDDVEHLHRHVRDGIVTFFTLGMPADVVLEVFVQVLHDQVAAAVLNVVQVIPRGTWKFHAI